MGTWGFRLDENDTFCEVVEFFKKQVLHSVPVENIALEILEKYKEAPDYVLVQEAVVECCWRLNCITEKDVAVIQRIISEQIDDKFWAELDADPFFRQNRKSELRRFLKRISMPPKASEVWILTDRTEPPPQKGSCFWYKSAGHVYGAVVLEKQSIPDFALYFIALTEELSSVPRKTEEILDAPVYTIAWFSSTELLNHKRMHLIGAVELEKDYKNKYGFQFGANGRLKISNYGQSETWKHTFRAFRVHEHTLREFVGRKGL